MTATASCNLSGKHTGGERPYRWVSQQMHIKVFTKKRIYFEECQVFLSLHGQNILDNG